jgi:hypothetical protein
VPEDLATTLPQLFLQLSADRSPIADLRSRLLSLPTSNFVADRGELAHLIAETLQDKQTPQHAHAGETA